MLGLPADRGGGAPSRYLEGSLFLAVLCSRVGMEGRGIIGSLNVRAGRSPMN